MSPWMEIALIGLGFLGLAAALVTGRRAIWGAVVGGGAVLALAVWNADPVLGLGLAAFLLARFLGGRPDCPKRPSAEGADAGRPRRAP